MAVLRILDAHFKDNTHMVGNRTTLADISIACTLVYPMRFLFEDKFRKNFPSLLKWFELFIQEKDFVQVWGKVRLCQKQLSVAHVEKPAGEKHGKKDEKPKPKEEAKKKEKKEDEDDFDDTPKDVVAKSALDSLPPSPFSLFDFKTLFVNAVDKNEALKFFWENFDNAGYSLYFVQYIKAEGEGKVLYQTNNLVGGFIQRLEHFRKHAFGVHGVYGDEPTLEVRGVWCWRGVGIPQEIKDLDQYEFHVWTKLEPSVEADKKKVQSFWTGLNDGDIVDGLTAHTVKYFK